MRLRSLAVRLRHVHESSTSCPCASLPRRAISLVFRRARSSTSLTARSRQQQSGITQIEPGGISLRTRGEVGVRLRADEGAARRVRAYEPIVSARDSSPTSPRKREREKKRAECSHLSVLCLLSSVLCGEEPGMNFGFLKNNPMQSRNPRVGATLCGTQIQA